jgi:hypothetical protein
MTPSGAGALASALVALALVACRGDRGERYECRCAFLTDFDDASGSRLGVCAAADDEAVAAARGCAQSAAPAPVQSCACERARGAPPCRRGDCEVSPHR